MCTPSTVTVSIPSPCLFCELRYFIGGRNPHIPSNLSHPGGWDGSTTTVYASNHQPPPSFVSPLLGEYIVPLPIINPIIFEGSEPALHLWQKSYGRMWIALFTPVEPIQVFLVQPPASWTISGHEARRFLSFSECQKEVSFAPLIKCK
jgi:hypothetical protein